MAEKTITWYNKLKEDINGQIKQNGRREITGAKLNSVLNKMVDALGKNMTFGGVVSPATVIDNTDDNPVFYLALVAGTYPYCGNIMVGQGQIAILFRDANNIWYQASWNASDENFTEEEKTKLQGLPTVEELREALGAKANAPESKPGSDNLASFDEDGNLKDSGLLIPVPGVEEIDHVLASGENGLVWMPKPADGDDAYGVYEKEYKEGHGGSTDGMLTRPQWLASLKGEKGNNAPQPFKGWFTPSTIPLTGQEGDYCYVDDDGTTKVWRWNPNAEPPAFEETADTPDTDHTQTFASNESVNQVAIDGSKLVNPVNTADPNKPVLAKAEDVMQLKAKLEGVTASETKINGLTVNGSYIDGSDGSIQQGSNYAEYNVAGYDTIRFLGYTIGSGTYGFRFLDSNDGIVTAKKYPSNSLTGGTSNPYEFLVTVPEGSVKLQVTVFNAQIPLQYCYGIVGKTALEQINDVQFSLMIKEQVDMDSFELIDGVVMSSGKWYINTTTPTQKHICVPCKEGDVFLAYNTLSKGIQCSFGLLTESPTTIVNGDQIPYVQGTGIIFLYSFKPYTLITVPAGCNFLCVTANASKEYLPSLLLHYKKPVAFEKADEKIDKDSTNIVQNQAVAKAIDNVAKNVVINNKKYVFSENDVINAGIISATGLWDNRDFCIQLLVKEGDVIELTASDFASARYVFLANKEQNPVNGSEPSYIPGETLHTINVGEKTTIIAPTDCCLYIQLGGKNSSFTPYPFAPKELVIKRNADKDGNYSNTFVEAPYYKKITGKTVDNTGVFSNATDNIVKFYELESGKDYKLICRVTNDTTTNIVSFFNGESGVNYLGGCCNTSDVEGGEKDIVMEDLEIKEGATVVVLSYPKTSNCALMVAADNVNLEQKLKSNYDFLYFVSNIRYGYIANEYNRDGKENITVEDWSAWALNLPETYSQVGKKTPIYSAFHGSGGFVTSEIMSYDSWRSLVRTPFNNAGIATFDINGYGVSFASDNKSSHWGCPAAVETVRVAFDFIKQHFNVCDKMVLGGLSMGGAICTSYAKNYPSDVIAVAVMAPTNLILSALYQDYPTLLTAWSYTSEQELKEDNAQHLLGYAPFAAPFYLSDGGVITRLAEYPEQMEELRDQTPLIESFPVPVTIWHGTEDENVPYEHSQMLVNAIRRIGGNARLRICPQKDHYLTLVDYVMQELVDYVKNCFAL